jgi:predicted  nucleic acid-binding Zn-ribbon protein
VKLTYQRYKKAFEQLLDEYEGLEQENSKLEQELERTEHVIRRLKKSVQVRDEQLKGRGTWSSDPVPLEAREVDYQKRITELEDELAVVTEKWGKSIKSNDRLRDRIVRLEQESDQS